jgi:hypothetical protein
MHKATMQRHNEANHVYVFIVKTKTITSKQKNKSNHLEEKTNTKKSPK